MKKSIVVILMVLAVVLSACGTKPTPTAAPVPTPTDTPMPSPTPKVNSGDGTEPVMFVIDNQSAETVQVSWMDFDGVEQSFSEIAPASALRIDSYNTYTWRLRDAAGNILADIANTADGYQAYQVGADKTVALVEDKPFELIYYDIQGSTENELRDQMTTLGPVDPNDNKNVDALVDWYIEWGWSGYGTATCDLNSAEVSYEMTITLPRWTPPADASPALVTKWNNYIAAVLGHEMGHVNNIVDNYGAVLTAIQAATCETADAAATAALQPLHQFDKDYDAQTNHGATQGAVFP